MWSKAQSGLGGCLLPEPRSHGSKVASGVALSHAAPGSPPGSLPALPCPRESLRLPFQNSARAKVGKRPRGSSSGRILQSRGRQPTARWLELVGHPKPPRCAGSSAIRCPVCGKMGGRQRCVEVPRGNAEAVGTGCRGGAPTSSSRCFLGFGCRKALICLWWQMMLRGTQDPKPQQGSDDITTATVALKRSPTTGLG